MSDGPYRSLPMPRHWKKVAEWAENENFDAIQLGESLSRAVLKDFGKDISRDALGLILPAFEEGEGDLFPDQLIHDLSNVRRYVDGSPLASLFLDCVDLELANGNTGQQGIVNAAKATIDDQIQRRTRQIEEHYLRSHDSSKELATNVRLRIQQTISLTSTHDIARKALGIETGPNLVIVRREGLDDGVPIP